MNLGQLLGGAGVVGRGMREAEEAERVARQDQLAIEEQNRLADLKAQMARSQLGSFQPQAAPDFGAMAMGGTPFALSQSQAFPVDVVPAVSAPAAPAAAAPTAPAAAAPAAPAMRPAPVEQYQLGAMTVSPAPVVSAPTAARLTQNVSEMVRMREMRVRDVQAGLDRLVAGNAPARMIENQKQLLAREQQLLETSRRGIERVEEGRQRGEQLAAQQAAAQRDANVLSAEQQGILSWQLNAKGQPIRGLVNNNPGNIRPDARYQWEGAVGVDKGEKERAGFVQFATPEAGIRALTMNLMSYDAQGFNTPRAIINRWAPPSDQPGKSNTNYITAVAKALGVKPTDTINLKDPAVMQQLVASIIEFENGKQPYAANVLAAGITAGLNRQSLAAPGAAPAAAAAPGGVRPMTAAEIARLRQDPYAMGTSAAAPAVPAAMAPAATAGIAIPGISSAQAAAPTAAAPAQQVAPARVDAEFYLANPQAIPYEQQQLDRMLQQQIGLAQQQATLLTRQRNEAAQMAQMYMRSGTAQGIEAATRLQGAINQYDGSLLQVQQQVSDARQKVAQGRTYLEGMQGLQEFELANDPRRLASVWSLYAGVPIGIQPRSDGKFNIMVNGKKTKEGVSATELTNSARMAFDQTYRQQQAAAGAEYNKKMFEARLDIQKTQATQLAQMIREIAVERVRGNNSQALEWAKANYGWDVKPTGAGDGTVIIRAPGSPPYMFNPTGKTVEIDGVKVQSNAAYPIAGLPSFSGQAATPTR
jgi:hypothetical protein